MTFLNCIAVGFGEQNYNNSPLVEKPDIIKMKIFHIYVKYIEKIFYLCNVK